jgi:hypothetical protein
VVEEDGWTHRRHTCFLGVGEQRRKIMPWERLYPLRSLVGREPGETDKRGKEVQVTGERHAIGTRLADRGGDDQRYVCVLFVAEWPLALQAAMGTSHLAVIRREDHHCVPP